MATQTAFPTRPQRHGELEQQIWTVWSMLQYFANSVYDGFINGVFGPFVAKFASGSALVPNTNTTLAVVHGLGVANYSVHITPTGGNPGAVYWVSGKTSSQFVINLSVAAGAGGVPFDWLVKAV